MSLDLLALTETSPAAAGASTFQTIRLYHRTGTRWVAATVPTDGPVWEQLQVTDQRIGQAMAGMANPNPAGYLAGFRNLTSQLYKRIVSKELNETIQATAVPDATGAPPVLRLHLGYGLDIVPWELLHDGTDFLGLRFQISRLPMVPGGPAQENGEPVPVRRVVSLLGRNLIGDPLRDAWQHTFDHLAGHGTEVVRQPADGGDDFPDLETLVGNENAAGDIVHLTCHGIQSGLSRYWTLDHTKGTQMLWTIYPNDSETFDIRRTAPLVFANACASAVGVGGGGAAAGWFDALGEGFGTQFYDGGARAFIGTFAPVTDRVAITFAKRFFEFALVQGKPVGEALWATKAAFKAENEPDPSWLFYCLYGEAGTRYVPDLE
jgi:hypothetical protein